MTIWRSQTQTKLDHRPQARDAADPGDAALDNAALRASARAGVFLLLLGTDGAVALSRRRRRACSSSATSLPMLQYREPADDELRATASRR